MEQTAATDLSQESVNSEEIYAEALPQMNPREELEAAANYFKDQYALLAEVCESQNRKIEEFSKMQDSDVFELQNELYECKSQMNAIKAQSLAKIGELKMQNEATVAEYETELARLKEEHEKQLQEQQAYFQEQVTSSMNNESISRQDQQTKHHITELTAMVEKLQSLNLQLEEERVELANRLETQRAEFAQEQQRLRAEMNAQLANLSRSSASSNSIELRETKKQLDDLLNRHSLLTIEHNKLKAERDSLGSALEQKLEELSVLKETLELKDEELRANQRELEAALRKIPEPDESYSKILDDSKAERSGERQIELLHEQLSRLRNNYDAEMSVLYQKELELNHEKEARASKEEEIRHFCSLYEQSKKLQEHTDQELERAKRLLKQKEDECSELKQAEEIKQTHYKQSLQQTQDHIRKLNEYINQSEATAEADKAKLLSEVTRLNNELSERDGRLLSIKMELIQVKDAYDTQKEAKSDLRRRMLDLQEQNATHFRTEQSRISRLEHLRGSESFEVNTDSQQSQTMEQLRQANHKLRADVQRLQGELEQHNINSAKSLKEWASEVEQQNARSQELAKKLETERGASRRIIERLQADLAQKESECIRYKEKIEDTQKTDRAPVEQYAELQLKSKVSKMEDQMSELKRLNNELVYKLAAMSSECQQLSQIQQEKQRVLEQLRDRLSHKTKEQDAAMRELDTKTSQYNYCKQLLAVRTLELEETKTRLNLKLLEDEGKTRQSVIRMENMLSQEQLSLKDEQMRILSSQLGFQKQLVARLQTQLAKQKELADAHLQKEADARAELLRLQNRPVEKSNAVDYQKIVENTSRLNEQLNQEVKRCYDQIAEMQRELHERSMIRNESIIGNGEQLRQLEKAQSDLSRQLAQTKLELGTYQTKERFLEIKLQQLRREKEAMSSIARDKRKLEEELKSKEAQLSSVERQRALLEHECDILQQDNISKDNNIVVLRSRLAETECGLGQHRTLNEDLEQKQSQLSMELTLKTGEIVQYRQELQNKELMIAGLEESIRRLTRECTQAKDAATELSKQCEQRKASYEALRLDFNQRMGEIDNWRRQERHLSRSIEEQQSEQESLRTLLERKQVELSDSKAYIDQLKEEAQKVVSTLKRELVQHKGQLEAAMVERAKAQQEANSLRENMERKFLQQSQRFKEGIEAAKRENLKLQEGRIQQSAKLKEVSVKLEQAQLKLDDLTSQRTDLSKLLADAEHREREQDARLNEESTNNRRLSNEIKQIKQQTSLQKGQYDKLLQQFELLKSKNVSDVEQLQRNLEEMNNRYINEKKLYEEKHQQRLRDQTSTFNRLTSDNGKLEFELQSANRQALELRQSVAKYKHERQALLNELAAEREGKIQFERKLVSQEESMRLFEERVKALTDEIERLKHDNSTVTFRDARLNETVVQAERDKLIEYIAELQEKCRTLETQQASNSRSRLAIRYGENTRVNQLLAKIETLNGTVRRLEGQINSITHENSKLFAQTSSLNNTILQLKMENERLSISPNRSERDLATIQSLQAQIDRLNSVLLDKEEEISRLKNGGTIITKIDYLQPEFVAPSPLNFHTLLPQTNSFHSYSHVSPNDTGLHSQQHIVVEPTRYITSSRSKSPVWTGSNSHLRYELQPVPVTNSPIHSTASLTRPY